MKNDRNRLVEKAIQDIRDGRMVVVVDDEDRENEGDLCMAASRVTPEAINFMAREARGLICLSLTEERVRALSLPMMGGERHGERSTAFTVSIEAASGVSTGISAADRACTISVAVDPSSGPEAITTPGHVFPLRARNGGVLQRTGHTEGSVDLARLAGLTPAGVICEIMNEDGTMARRPDLDVFAAKHNLTLISIADLVEYRLQHESLTRKVYETTVSIPGSERIWSACVYRVETDSREVLALSTGELDHTPTLVRVHTQSLLGDAFSVAHPSSLTMRAALRVVDRAGKGAVLVFPARGGLQVELAFATGALQEKPAVDPQEVLREYGVGAQILRDLGLRDIRLLTNRPRRLPSLDGYGLSVVEQCSVTLDETLVSSSSALSGKEGR